MTKKKMTNEKPMCPNNSWKFKFVDFELVVGSGEFIKHFISLYPLQSSPLAYNCKWNTFLFIWIPTVSSCSQLFFSFGRPGHIFFAQSHYFLWAWVTGIREQMSDTDLHLFTLKFLALKTGFFSLFRGYKKKVLCNFSVRTL